MFPPIDMANLGQEGGNVSSSDTSDTSKGYVFISQEENGGITEFESRDITFLKNTFPRQGEISPNLSLFETLDQEGLLHSSGSNPNGGDILHLDTPMAETNEAIPTSSGIVPYGNDPSGINTGSIQVGAILELTQVRVNKDSTSLKYDVVVV